VSQTIPVNLAVGVDIPLAQTELGRPFNDLQMIFHPLYGLLQGLPSTNGEFYERIQSSVITPEVDDTGVATSEAPDEP